MLIMQIWTEFTVSCENEAMNSEECSELDTISVAVMLFNSGYVGHYDEH